MQSKTSHFRALRLELFLLLFTVPTATVGQTLAAEHSLVSRLNLDQARRLVTPEDEGNLLRQDGRFTRTRLPDGRILEIFYPLQPGGRAPRHRAPGYGLLYASEAAYRETIRPRHMLEDLLPDGHDFISRVPQLIRRFEKRLNLGAGRLELNRTGLRRIDRYLRNHHASHTTAETDPLLFQELTACYGEAVRRAVNGHWTIHKEQVSPGHLQTEPNITFGANREIKPWSSIIRALHDEDSRGIGLARSFDSDVGAGN